MLYRIVVRRTERKSPPWNSRNKRVYVKYWIRKNYKFCYLTQLSRWNFKICSCIQERSLVFTDMWFEAYAPKRFSGWHTGTMVSPGSPRRYTRRWKACKNRLWGNFPYHFSDSVIPIHDNVRLQIWHQAVFICFPPWRNTYQDIMKCDTFTRLTQHGHTFSTSWEDNLILWLVFQPSRRMCWKCTSYIFIVYC